MSTRDMLRIMVVDDMSTSRGLLTQALEASGIRHITATASGQEALDAIARSPVHLIISDFNMPGMDGLALLEQVRRNPATQRTGFIIVTGRIDPAIIQKGQALGLNNLIAKPFTPSDLLACVEKVVGRL